MAKQKFDRKKFDAAVDRVIQGIEKKEKQDEFRESIETINSAVKDRLSGSSNGRRDALSIVQKYGVGSHYTPLYLAEEAGLIEKEAHKHFLAYQKVRAEIVHQIRQLKHIFSEKDHPVPELEELVDGTHEDRTRLLNLLSINFDSVMSGYDSVQKAEEEHGRDSEEFRQAREEYLAGVRKKVRISIQVAEIMAKKRSRILNALRAAKGLSERNKEEREKREERKPKR